MAMTDGDLAAHLADQAGKILLQVRASGMFEGKSLGKAGDQTANQFLVHALREQRGDDGLLSEEEKDNPERLAKERVRSEEHMSELQSLMRISYAVFCLK